MKISKRAKRMWVDDNVYSFTIGTSYNNEIVYKEDSTSSCRYLSNELEQIKDKLRNMSFPYKFWSAKEYALKLGLEFSYVTKVI